MPDNPSLQQLIDRYNRRLMQYHQQANQSPPPSPHPTPPAPPGPPERPPAPPAPQPPMAPPSDRPQMPVAPIPDRPTAPPPPPPRPAPQPVPPTLDPPEPAILRVRVFTARQAIPIEGARVWISSVEPDGSLQLRARVVTNGDGLTRPVSVPAASMSGDALPTTPGASSEYVVEVWAEDYLPAQRRIVLVGGQASELPVEMLPTAGSAERSGAYA